MKPAWMSLALMLALAPLHARAQQAGGELPKWEQLSPQQREQLLTPLRERWNQADAGERQRMWQHAQRWSEMPPEERARARRGMRRFEDLTPQQRSEMRVFFEHTRDLPKQQRREAFALFHAMRGMSREDREALRLRWGAMSQAERDAWMQQHRPRHGPPPRD